MLEHKGKNENKTIKTTKTIVNILIVADYRSPKSGNFIASLLDLTDMLSEQGGTTVFNSPIIEMGTVG